MEFIVEMELFEPIGEALVINGTSDYKSEIPFSLITIIFFILSLCHK